MFKDNPKKVIERILKDKDKQYLEFEYKVKQIKIKKRLMGEDIKNLN